jgi:UDP-GlcNAc:undecaprenyl-phosphate GlcNAc-1-phosphate transferase
MGPATLQCAVVFAASLVMAFLTTPIVLRLAVRFGVVRRPRQRDIHTVPMPLWGGIAIYFSALIPPLIALRGIVPPTMTGILIGATLVAVAGMLDDRLELSALWQSVVILLAGFTAAMLGARVEFISDPRGGMIFLGAWAVPATVAWMFLVTKSVDMVDGLDGLAAGVSAIAAASLGMIALGRHDPSLAVWAAGISGACVGFLKYNFTPASIFMGTVGAQFLGFMLAGLSVVGVFKMAAVVTLVLPLLVLGVPVLDAVRVVALRVLRGQPAHVAAKDHFHHILLKDWGLSTKSAVIVLYVASAIFGLAALFIFAIAVR